MAPKVGSALTPSGRSAALHHGRLPDGTVPRHYDVALTLDPNQERFSGQVSVAVEMLEPQDTLLMHAASLDIDRVAVMDSYGRRHKVDLGTDQEDVHNDLLRLHITPPMPAGMATVYISYSAAYSVEAEGLYRTQVDGHTYVQSQMQPTAARRVLPCFDEPRFRTPFNVVLTVPSDVTCLGNSQTVGVRDAHPGHKAWAFEATPPLPVELLGFTVGPLVGTAVQVPISPQRPYTLDLRSYAAGDVGAKNLAWAAGRFGPLLQDLEAYVDMPYPFSKLDFVAAPDNGYRAMDSAALLTLRDWLVVADGSGASYSKRRAFEMTAAWGLSLQWFGAWVNNAWWDDVWLPASLSNWRGLRAAHHTRKGMQFDLEQAEDTARAMAHDGYGAAAQVHARCHTQDDILAANAPDAVRKGVALLTMFEHGVGKERFRDGVRTYLRRHPYQSTTTAAFLAAVSEGAAAPELTEGLTSFLDQSGIPEVSFAWECSGGGADLIISQERYRPLGGAPASGTWSLPICFRIGQAHDRRARHPICVQLTEAQTQVRLQGCPASLVPNADGAGYYRSKVAYEQLPAVLRGMDSALMTAPEFFVALDNLAAALAAGTLPAHSVLGGIEMGLEHPNPRIVGKALALLRDTFEQYVQPSEHGASAATWRRLVAAAQRSLILSAKGDSSALSAVSRVGAEANDIADRRDELSLLRHEITWAHATLGQDTGTQANLAHAGAHWLDAQETLRHIAPTPSSKPSRGAATLMADDVALALAHGAQAFGAPFVQRLVELLGHETDSEIRRHLLMALTALPSQGPTEALFNLVLSPVLRPQERLPFLQELMAHGALRPVVWSFVGHHLDTLLQLLPQHHKSGLITLGAALCDGDGQALVANALLPHLPSIPGGERALALAVERNAVCAAQVAAQSFAVTQYFKGAVGSSPAP